MRGAIHPLPQCAFMVWRSVKKQRDKFTFYLYLKCYRIVILEALSNLIRKSKVMSEEARSITAAYVYCFVFW
jgi:hypothetical protein